MNKYMELAYKEAKKAYKKNEIPVGAVIVKDDKILSKSHNNRQKNNFLLGHAEINSILKAEKKIKDWRLDGCTMYVTLIPCEMCQMIIKESRISKIYYLLNNKEKTEYNSKKYIQTNDCNELKAKYKKLINIFFNNLRK